MLDVRYSHLYFYQSLNRLQLGLSAIAELLVIIIIVIIINGGSARGTSDGGLIGLWPPIVVVVPQNEAL